ncbi:MAG: cobalamin biosynthesis protein CobQ [Paracoccaceae bacterium]|nr:cobalamin biosynthesis protein CobQ [Paracoccaceae bacterium]
MNTPAHLLIGAAAFGRGPQKAVVWAAFAGALLPDLSLYVLAGSALFVFGLSPDVVFNDLYYSDAWQTIFAIDNSFLIWGAAFGVALWYRKPWAIALSGAGLLHLCLDFPLHHDDGRAHFWPVTRWVFESPFSYWDRAHCGLWFAPLGAFFAVIAATALWRRKHGWPVTGLVGVLLLAELWVVSQWMFFFTDS